jgi:hypothetical protein
MSLLVSPFVEVVTRAGVIRFIPQHVVSLTADGERCVLVLGSGNTLTIVYEGHKWRTEFLDWLESILPKPSRVFKSKCGVNIDTYGGLTQ